MVSAINVINYNYNHIYNTKYIKFYFILFIYLDLFIFGSMVNLYLQNQHASVVMYDSFISSFRLWYAELALIMVI